MKQPYAKWFEVCNCAAQDLSKRGNKYRPGVERAAALAAVEQQEHGCGIPACIQAIEETFAAYRVSINPRWDGSVA